MTHLTYTDLALSDFKLNTSLTVANPSSQDEQSIAQAHTQDPLTYHQIGQLRFSRQNKSRTK
jgi:cytochrome c biogenesis protein ResB